MTEYLDGFLARVNEKDGAVRWALPATAASDHPHNRFGHALEHKGSVWTVVVKPDLLSDKLMLVELQQRSL